MHSLLVTIKLIREWLSNRSYYVQVGEECSVLFDSDTGTIQGSVLGPVLYALFVSPLFDLDDLVIPGEGPVITLVKGQESKPYEAQRYY